MDNRDKLVIERLQQILDESGASKAELARVSNKTPQAVNNWFKNGKISIDSARLICEKYGYSVNWLLGSEDILDKNEVAVIEDKDYSDTHIEIDLYDVKLSAGTGKGCVVEWIPRKSEEPLLFRQAWFKQKNLTPESCKAMFVRGHSMYPVLKDWDTVIVNIHDTDIVDGEIYALTYKNNFYIKQVVRNGDKITLLSFNPEYKPIEVAEDQLSELNIIGRQVWRGG
ncbi:TPA: LexA family transcriptional regulator [Pasteurella multocida]|nr:LexA family transcriptional regulator [Pasteurella multocida]HDR1816772.1 LexA family transcriptional regulator [Pasteurella multocida]